MTPATCRSLAAASGRIAALALLCAAGATLAVGAERAEPLPRDLQGVDVVEHLDAPLPLQLEFVDERGSAVALGKYFKDDKPVLLVLGYYRCPMLCSLVLNGLIDTLKQIDRVPGKQFEIVYVSIDPEETPKTAAFKKQNYLEAYGRSEGAAGWHFLTGREENIRKLAESVGFGYAWVESRGEYAHPAVLFVGTPDGRIARYLYGVKYDPRTLRLSLVEASAGKIGTTVERLLLYCYHYDPSTGTYAPFAMNMMRLGGALTLLVLGTVLIVLWRRFPGRSGPDPAAAAPRESGHAG